MVVEPEPIMPKDQIITEAEPKADAKEEECVEEYPHGLITFLLLTVGALVSATAATTYFLFIRKGVSE